MSLRQLGSSDLQVTPVGFGCWPIAGITSIIDSEAESLAAIEAALEAGVNFFDTAYSYGYAGESDHLLRRAITGKRDRVILASKAGTHWNERRERVVDARPETLIRHAEETLHRLNVDYVDLFYLHTPDGQTPIEESAAAIAEIVRRGWSRYAAVSNVDLAQAQAFHRVCPVVAIQPYFNMLQQKAVCELRDFCIGENIAIVCYWALMKGLLAGHMQRDHQFDPRDRRLNYDIFRGETWQRNQDFVDGLRQLARERACTVSQLVIAWTVAQSAVTVALCGAKRPQQIIENAGAMSIELGQETLSQIDSLIAQRGRID